MRLGIVLILLAALAGPSSAQISGTYNIVVDGNGSAVVTLVASGQGTVNIPLPLDVKSPAVRDALYVKAKNGMEVSIDAGGQSTILYRSALHTTHDGGAWKFRLQLPRFDSATVVLYVPEEAEITDTVPTAAISHVGLSKSVVWNIRPSEDRFVEADYAIPQQKGRAESSEPLLSAALIIVVVLFLTVATVYLVLRRRAEDGE